MTKPGHFRDANLFHSVAQPHDGCRLATGLSLGGVQCNFQVSHTGELRMDLLIWIHKVLNLRHGELPETGVETIDWVINYNVTSGVTLHKN